MPKLTKNLTDRTLRFLKEAAARRGCSISDWIEECMESRRFVSSAEAMEIAARARANAGLNREEAVAVAVNETGRHRAGRSD